MQQSVPKHSSRLPTTVEQHSLSANQGRVVYGMPHHAPYGAHSYHYANPAYHYHTYQQYPVYPYLPMVDPSAIYQQQEALYHHFPATMEQLNQLRRQVEYYFSYENLVGDKYLLKQMEVYKGMVPCHIVANFRRVVVIMGGVPASNQLLTLALLQSNVVRVLFGQYLVPSAGVFSRVLETRARMQSRQTNDDATAGTVSSSSSTVHSKDCEQAAEVSGHDSSATSLAETEDTALFCPPPPGFEEVFEEKKEDLFNRQNHTLPDSAGPCRTLKEQLGLKEEKRAIDEDNSKLLKGLLGLTFNEQDS